MFSIPILCFRGHKSFPSVCSDVRDAILQAFMGGCSALGTKSAILYLAEWRISYSDQGLQLFLVLPFQVPLSDAN